jgi:hypothetical protein
MQFLTRSHFLTWYTHYLATSSTWQKQINIVKDRYIFPMFATSTTPPTHN